MKKKSTMIRTTIYLPEQVHRGMKIMAAANSKSMADLLREALVQVYKDDLADIRDGMGALREHRRHPNSDISIRDYRAKGS